MGIANAQLFVGGNLGFSMNNGSNKTTYSSSGNTDTRESDAPKMNEWTVSPKIGFQSGKLAFGVAFGIGGQKWHAIDPSESELDAAAEDMYSDLMTKAAADEEDWTINRTKWGVTPFVRYNAIEAGNFALFLEAQVPINGSTGKVTSKITEDGVTTTREEIAPKTFSWGLEIVPGLSYNLNDHIAFDVYLDLIRLGFTQNKVSYEEDADDKAAVNYSWEKKSNDFHIGLYSLPAAVTIGFVYKF